MHRSLATTCLISLTMLMGIARGQAGAPAGAVPPRYGFAAPIGTAVPAWSPPGVAAAGAWSAPGGTAIPAWSAPGGTARPVSFGEAEPVQAAPEAASSTVPPDPDPAHWGNYGQPGPVPVALPAVEYSLVGPPRGIVQPTAPPEYRAVVANPEAVPDNDIWLTQAIDLNRADGLAPSGVFGAVTLPTGHFIASYGYLQNTFDHAFVGNQQVSNASVLARYPFAPTRGLSDSQVATLTYGVTDDLTITGSLPFEHNQIDYAQSGARTCAPRSRTRATSESACCTPCGGRRAISCTPTSASACRWACCKPCPSCKTRRSRICPHMPCGPVRARTTWCPA